MLNLSLVTATRLRSALAAAAATELQIRGRAPKGSEIVFRAFADAIDIMRRMPDHERRWLRGGGKSSWPGLIRTLEEREEGYRQQLWLVIKGLASSDSLISEPPVTPHEQAVMDDVFTVFRACCVGRSIGRDWSILSMLAVGVSPAQVAKRQKPRVSRPLVLERKRLQCDAIAAKLWDLITG
jgi:hypothetical protein